MKTNRGWLLLALPLTLAACGGDDEVDTTLEGIDTATVATATTDTAAHDMAAMPMTVAMQPVGNSGVTGQATLTPSGTQTQVQVQVTGLTPGAHPGHIHTGNCAAPGPVVQPLPEITAGADGSGSANTTLALDHATLMNGQHMIGYHGEGGAVVVCAELTPHTM